MSEGTSGDQQWPGGQTAPMGEQPAAPPPGSTGPAGPGFRPGPAWGAQPAASWNQPPAGLPAGADWGFKDRKVPAGICGILFGALGVHKFVLGYVTEGVIMAAVTVVGSLAFFLSLFLPFVIAASSSSSDAAGAAWFVALLAIWGVVGIAITAVWVIGLVEGVLYLTKSDRDFVIRYNVEHHGWF